MGACRSNASCRSCRLVMHEYVLSCFSKRVLKWERAFRLRLVMHEYVLSCFSERVLKWERAVRMRLVGLVHSVMYEHVLPNQYQRYCK